MAKHRSYSVAFKRQVVREFLKGARRHEPPPTSAPTSVITGPTGSASPKDAD